jgi:hypothetical protein
MAALATTAYARRFFSRFRSRLLAFVAGLLGVGSQVFDAMERTSESQE